MNMTYYALKSAKNNEFVKEYDESTATIVFTQNIREAATFHGEQETEFYVNEFKNQLHVDLIPHEIM